MSPTIAIVVYALGILGLFWLDKDPDEHTSSALWIPVIWFLIAGSRPVTLWLGVSPSSDSPDQYIDGSPLDRMIFIGLMAIGILVLLRRGQKVSTIIRRNPVLLFFLFYCALSLIWSEYTFVAFKRWIKTIGDIVMVLVVLTDPDCKAAMKRLLARCGFILLPASILLIKFFGDLGRDYRPDFGNWAVTYTGVNTSKSGLGMISMIFGIGAVWRLITLLQEKGTPGRVRHCVAQFILLATALWLFSKADSMTSLLCFLMASTVILVTSLRSFLGKRAIIHIMVVFMISFSLFALFGAPSLLQTVGRNPTLTGRTEIWDVVLNMDTNPILGTGFESFWLGKRLQKVWDLYWWHPNEAHNGYIETYLNLGLLGLVILAVLILSGYRTALDALGQEPSIGRLRLAFFVVALIYNCTESAFRIMNPIWFVFLIAIIDVPYEDRAPQPILESVGPKGVIALSARRRRNEPAVASDLRRRHA
jgi:exopolysaccharide production protein ExoQ